MLNRVLEAMTLLPALESFVETALIHLATLTLIVYVVNVIIYTQKLLTKRMINVITVVPSIFRMTNYLLLQLQRFKIYCESLLV